MFRLLSQSHTFAIIVILDLKIHQSMWIHWLFFPKNLNQRSLTPRWPLTPYLLRSHVWLYSRIIVSKSHDNTLMYVDTVINFAKYHIHTHTTYYVHTTCTYYVHITYRVSDHIVSYWTQFRRDNYWTQFRRDKNTEMGVLQSARRVWKGVFRATHISVTHFSESTPWHSIRPF